MLLFLHFIKFSSSHAIPCYIVIFYILMNKREIFFRLFRLDNLKPYIVYLYFYISFWTGSIYLFQVTFLSIITPRNLLQDSHFILILFWVIVGNLNGILSCALCLSKNVYLIFPALREFSCYKQVINIV